MSDNGDLNKFCTNVFNRLADKKSLSHYPNHGCSENGCIPCLQKGYDWAALRETVVWFWEHGPEVDDNWKQSVRRTGLRFEADAFHDLCLGVFIGAAQPDKASDFSAYTPNP